MRKNSLIAIGLMMVLLLSACGDKSNEETKGNSGTPSENVIDNNDNPSSVVSPPVSNAGDDIVNAITAETAEAMGICGTDLAWYYQNNILVIRGTGDMTDYHGGLTDSEKFSAPWYDYDDGSLISQIGRIVIDEGITSVGDIAFNRLESVSKVILPSTLTRIGDRAFANCINLKEIVFPASLDSIGENAFSDCNELKTITFLGNMPNGFGEVLYRGSSGGIDFPEDANEETKAAILAEYKAKLYSDITIYYSGDTFDEWIEEYPGVNWIKQ